MAIPAVIQALRPKQWVKNVLVIAAPFAAGRIGQRSVIIDVIVAFVAFCLASSAVYLLNDVRDAPKDRLHPVKKNRPIATGQVSPTVAVVLAAVLLIVSLGIASLAEPALLWVIIAYLLIQALYVFWLKNQPVLDLAVVASGFLLRALAGGAATGIAISDWFLLVAGFGSLFVVAGKRYSEMVNTQFDGSEIGQTRSTLTSYTQTYLRFVWTVAAALTIMVYSLWVITVPRQHTTATLLSLVPFALGLLVYALAVDNGDGGEPETEILRNPVLIGLGILWAATLGITLYI